MQSIMSDHFAFSRNLDDMEKQLKILHDSLQSFCKLSGWERTSELGQLFKSRDMLITQIAYAESMLYSGKTAGSRGGAFVLQNNQVLPENTEYLGKKIITVMNGNSVTISERDVRPLPANRDLWFEKVWKKHRERHK